jgi:enoyl-CoA hydratase/carnithine racemase
MKYETILVESGEGIATITLNRPKSMNALNGRMLEDLARVFGESGKETTHGFSTVGRAADDPGYDPEVRR